MNQRLQTSVEVIGLAIVGGFVGAIALIVFVDLFWSADTKPTEAFRGAFLGAFFAFVFVRFGGALTAIFERREKARNGLITAQHRLGEIINALHDNAFVFARIDEYEAGLRAGPPPIFLSTFIPIPGIRDLVIPLLNLDLINELVGLDIEIRKTNDSVKTWERTNEKLLSAFISKQLDLPTYKHNALAGVEEAKLLGKYFEALKKDSIQSLAAVRILARRDQTLVGKAMLAFGKKHYEQDFEMQRATEARRLEEEAREINIVGLTNKLTAVQELRRSAAGQRAG